MRPTGDSSTGVDTPDARTLIFFLKQPMAAFLSGTLATPIVQEKEWSGISEKAKTTENPLATLINHRMEHPVGTGPFTLVQWRQGAFLHLKKNPHFFGKGKIINGRTLGPFVDDLVYSVYGTSDVAILALKKGDIDMFWWPIQPGYMSDLSRQKKIRLFTNEKSALYFMGFNLRKPPFQRCRPATGRGLYDRQGIHCLADPPGPGHQDVFGGAG